MQKRKILVSIALFETAISLIFYKVAKANGYCDHSNYIDSMSAEFKNSCILQALQSMPGYWFYIATDLIIFGMVAAILILWHYGKKNKKSDRVKLSP